MLHPYSPHTFVARSLDRSTVGSISRSLHLRVKNWINLVPIGDEIVQLATYERQTCSMLELRLLDRTPMPGSVVYSIARWLRRSIDCSIVRSPSRSITRSLRRSTARPLDRSVARSLHGSVDRSLDLWVGRSIWPQTLPILSLFGLNES